MKPVDPNRTVKDKAVIPMSPEQAAKIQKFLNNAKTSPPNYNLYHSNCAQFCESALRAGGVKDVPNDVTPRGLVHDLNRSRESATPPNVHLHSAVGNLFDFEGSDFDGG